MIKDLKENTRIKEAFLVSNSTKGVSTAGLPYLNITLQDASGSMDAKKWDIQDDDVSTFAAGNIVEVTGDVLSYRNTLQIKVISGTPKSIDEVDVGRFVSSAPVGIDELWPRFQAYLDRLQHPDVKAITVALIDAHKENYVIYPAASKNHHEFASGLLFHVVSMLDLASDIALRYPTLDTDLLFAGIILHDIGKTVELSGPIIPKYTLAGRLLGHISIAQAWIAEVAEKLQITSEVPVLLQHLVLSHHGKPEFGSPQVPQIREAEIIHYIDNLDARMVMMEKALEAVTPGEFTTRVWSLEDRSFYKPSYK